MSKSHAWTRFARMLSIRVRLLLVVLVVTPVAGCGGYVRPKGIPVSGTVTLDGKPVKAGSIVFSPRAVAGSMTAGGESAAAVIRDGQFSLSEDDGPPEGPTDVQIAVQRDVAFALDDEQAFAKALETGNGGSPVNSKVRFKDPQAKSVEIKADGPAFTFEMISLSTAPGPANGAENP